jgi:serine phosphatase RsbU (regulator of sigma subunit)
VLQSLPVEDSHQLPASIIQYVQRTQKPEVLDDATEEGMFTTDPYIVENRPKSILCTPLINQAKLIGILYLENNLTTGAFTPDRLEVLNLLSSQAAISIENASLYADLQSYSEELEEKNVALVRAHAIELDNIRKTEELERARELQLSMIPKTPPELPFLEISTHIETATEVGGDYFDFFPQDDGSLYLVVGDATGHGSAAGMMVSMTKTVLNSLDWLPPETMMGRLNGVMKRIQSKRSVQMALNISHIQSDAIRFSSAAMPPAFLFDSHTGKVEEIMVPGLPLGSGLRRMSYSVEQVAFNVNDTFVLISDGLPEARNEEGTYLSYEAVKACIWENGKSTAEEIKNALIALGENWLEGRPNEDDVTIVVVKRI